MTARAKQHPQQLGFDSLLDAAAADNETRQQERACAHLPGTMEEALPFYRRLIDHHHVAMIGGDGQTAMQLREEAHALALKLNNYEPGIIADDDSPGSVLDALTRAEEGAVPLWGQGGSFIITTSRMRVRIEMDGIFGTCGLHTSWMGFGAHAVDLDKPFLSETGYRSFLGMGGALVPGFTPATFAAGIKSARNLKASCDRSFGMPS